MENKQQNTYQINYRAKINSSINGLKDANDTSTGLELIISPGRAMQTLDNMKNTLESRQEERGLEVAEIKKLFSEHSLAIEKYDVNGVSTAYKVLSKFPLVGKYFHSKGEERHGTAVQRLRDNTEQKLSRVKDFLSKLNNDYNATSRQLLKLTELKQSAAEEWESYHQKEDEYQNKILEMKKTYDSLTPREKIGPKGTGIEKDIIKYHKETEDLANNVVKIETVIKNSTDLAAAYLTDLRAISSLIKSNAMLYNNHSFNIEHLKSMNLNITELKKGLVDIDSANTNYENLSLVANEALLKKSQFTKLDASLVERTAGSFFDKGVVETAANNLFEAAQTLNKTIGKRRADVESIVNGR